MKFNRNKMGLVVIGMVLVLALILSGCTTAPSSKTPDFLEVGGYYWVVTTNGNHLLFTLLEIENDGWILIEQQGERIWVNTAQLVRIIEEEKPE